ncbi:MAG: DUF2802 domain-containing protein [Gammaproteobacteria bacterium]|nr:DUF2802 domain-containing protein [Gammaproteobacteria bacterium]
MSTLLIAASLISLPPLAALLWLALRLCRQQREISRLHACIDTLAAEVGALCSGAAGVDRRVALLESHGRRLDLRQESLENQHHEERPYGEAIQLVQKGTSASGLVEKLGLSRSEAELVAMLHGARRAG